jgi:hypothetical protein
MSYNPQLTDLYISFQNKDKGLYKIKMVKMTISGLE